MKKAFSFWTLLLFATGAQADPPAPDPQLVPPSPFADIHGVYDAGSKCWLWDAGQNTAQKYIFQVDLTVEHKCDGAILDGQARVAWSAAAAHAGSHAGEVWNGSFAAGRFTGNAVRTFAGGEQQIRYADGLRVGPSVTVFKDGGRTEVNYDAGLRDGAFRDVYSDGSSRTGRYDKDRVVELKTCYRDGSCDTPASHFTPDGKVAAGVFHGPRLDRTNVHPFAYPPISRRLDEQGDVIFAFQVGLDGVVRDLRMVRSSGWERLDKAGMEWMANARFLPASSDSLPVTSQLIMPLSYHLNPLN